MWGIFVLETPQYTSIDLNETCIQLDIEICAVKLHCSSSNICVLSTYRSPSGIISYFLNTLESILNKIYTNSLNIIICRDISISYLDDDNTNKQRQNSILATFNLFSIIDFPTRINNISMSAIVNFFIDKYKIVNYTINPLPNGLSDHGVQLLVLNNIKIQNPYTFLTIRVDINNLPYLNLSCILVMKPGDNVFSDDVVNTVLNNFLSAYLRIYYHSFPLKKYIHNKKKNFG